MRNPYAISVLNLTGFGKLRGKYTCSWRLDLKDIEGEDVDWIYLA
jgi:hypothetical protein